MIFLLALHHIADVALQPGWLIQNKKKHWFAIYEHCFIWAGLISGGLYIIGSYNSYDFLILFIGHFLVDFVKYKYLTNYNWIYLDQLLHYLQILYAIQ